MSRIHLTIEPSDQPLGDWSVTASLGHDPAAGEVDVLVVISRPADLPPLRGEDLEVEVLSADERPFRLTNRPTGPLIEVGGSLGMSTNAQLRFVGYDDPAFLVVAAQGARVRFRVVAAPGNEV